MRRDGDTTTIAMTTGVENGIDVGEGTAQAAAEGTRGWRASKPPAPSLTRTKFIQAVISVHPRAMKNMNIG